MKEWWDVRELEHGDLFTQLLVHVERGLDLSKPHYEEAHHWYTPLGLALSREECSAVKMLLENGACPNSACHAIYGSVATPLEIAVLWRSATLYLLLLKFGADETSDHFSVIDDWWTRLKRRAAVVFWITENAPGWKDIPLHVYVHGILDI